MDSLGNIQNQNANLNNFTQFATGLGYDPQQVEAFSKVASMGEGMRGRREEEKRRKELEDYATKLRIQKSLEEETPKVKTIDDLLKTRESLMQAGLDTAQIDTQIGSMGVDPAKKAISKNDQIGIDLVDEIMARETKPLTGAIRLGNTEPGAFGLDPLGFINRVIRPELTTTKEKIEQLKGLLQLSLSGQLKGQGQLSDKEREMLKKASTSLDYTMSDTDFRKELTKIKSVLSGEKTTTTKGATDADSLINKYWKDK